MAIVVEGYMDCIACHQAGITNARGHTWGQRQPTTMCGFLKRFADKIVLNYDGDKPGQRRSRTFGCSRLSGTGRGSANPDT